MYLQVSFYHLPVPILCISIVARESLHVLMHADKPKPVAGKVIGEHLKECKKARA